MPRGIGYSRAERAKIAREKKSSGKVLGAVGGSLKAAALGQMSPAAKKRQEHLRQRAIQDRVTGRSGKTSKPVQPVQPKGFIEGVTSGRQQLIDALSQKPKKKR